MARFLSRRSAIAVALSLSGLLLAWTAERRSEERGDRLHRRGELVEATTIYRGRVDEGFPPARLHYNYTALLHLDGSAAPTELALGVDGTEDEVRVRALCNLGLWSLLHAMTATRADSVRAHAGRAVDANKDALRLSPGRPDVRWNLALAQRMLDSIEADDGRAGTESMDGSVDADGSFCPKSYGTSRTRAARTTHRRKARARRSPSPTKRIRSR